MNDLALVALGSLLSIAGGFAAKFYDLYRERLDREEESLHRAEELVTNSYSRSFYKWSNAEREEEKAAWLSELWAISAKLKTKRNGFLAKPIAEFAVRASSYSEEQMAALITSIRQHINPSLAAHFEPLEQIANKGSITSDVEKS